MKRNLHVKVEDYHIKCGKRNAGGACPVALAVTPMLPAGLSAYVGRGWIGVEGSDKKILSTHELPPAVDAFVNAFDAGESVKPFEFDLVLE